MTHLKATLLSNGNFVPNMVMSKLMSFTQATTTITITLCSNGICWLEENGIVSHFVYMYACVEYNPTGKHQGGEDQIVQHRKLRRPVCITDDFLRLPLHPYGIEAGFPAYEKPTILVKKCVSAHPLLHQSFKSLELDDKPKTLAEMLQIPGGK